MDKLFDCASRFQRLFHIQYRIILGRKGVQTELILQFEKIDFHHLAGLHKLGDIEFLRSGKREKVFDTIINGDITYEQIENSPFFCKMEERIQPLTELEQILDNNNIFFRYNKKNNNFSVIQAQFLIEGNYKENDLYLFLDQKCESGLYFCKTLFPKDRMDYTKGQTNYTLLYKEKINLLDGTVCVQYDRLSPKAKLGE